VIEKDDNLRREIGLPTPALKDYRLIHGLKPLKAAIRNAILRNHGILQDTLPMQPTKIQRERVTQWQGRGGGQLVRGARGAFTRGQLSLRGSRGFGHSQLSRGQHSPRARGGFGRGFRGGKRSFAPSGGYRYSLMLFQVSKYTGKVMELDTSLRIDISEMMKRQGNVLVLQNCIT